MLMGQLETLKAGLRYSCPEFFKRHRDRLYIIDEILRLAKKGMYKTTLMRKANLSYTQVVAYLQFLKNIQLVETLQNGRNRVVVTTKKGHEFMENYEKIIQLFIK